MPRTKKDPQRQATSVNSGCREHFGRRTFIVRDEYVEKLRRVAYWERLTIADVLDAALGVYLKDKKVEPIPG